MAVKKIVTDDGEFVPVTDKESEKYLISVLEAVREALQDNDVDGALLMIRTALGAGEDA